MQHVHIVWGFRFEETWSAQARVLAGIYLRFGLWDRGFRNLRGFRF